MDTVTLTAHTTAGQRMPQGKPRRSRPYRLGPLAMRSEILKLTMLSNQACPRRAGSLRDSHPSRSTTGLGRVWTGCGIPSTSQGLPRGPPGASLAISADREYGMLPSGHRVVGLRPVDGMPHQSQRARALDNSTPRNRFPDWPPDSALTTFDRP
jgi:hypothetical protein